MKTPKQLKAKTTIVLIITVICAFVACSNSEDTGLPNIEDPTPDRFMIKAIDASFVPELRALNIETFDTSGMKLDFLDILSNSGFNTIRLRLWHTPDNEHSSLAEVKSFANEIKAKGIKVWLDIHYSDTWADPEMQEKPKAWDNLSLEVLKDSVFQYTSKVISQIEPDYVQIGNEVNNGFLWPEGHSSDLTAFKNLIQEGVQAVRSTSPEAKIMLHYAGHIGAIDFFRDLNDIDYDIIALSYYPYWHGNKLEHFQFNFNLLSSDLNKEIVVAETIYPFASLEGTDRFLVSSYPATPVGQRDFVEKINEIVEDNPKGLGIGIWGGVTGAYMRPKPDTYNGTHWENQAVLNYDNVQLPILEIFQ
ncbi:glycosyl hydrolase 53 family protein [Aestuariivivens sediminis]|uniref:glycosyl hydrolase 53 family protein n=1 Tax=Aestuariivivens sediminis TaxID=2913557 RepID=UPI001F5A49C6|nr:glycosyl hydrolase 53 family protein [Aestuariivivens sediminis]